MKEQALFGVGFGLILLMCLPFFLQEKELIEKPNHIHKYQPIPYGQGLKTVYVRVCLTDSMLVDANGNHHNKERFKQITQ